MSIAARAQRRITFPWVAMAVLTAAAIAATAVAVVAVRESPSPVPLQQAAETARAHSPWRVTLSKKAMAARPGSSLRADLVDERAAVAGAIQGVYDALFLHGDVDAAARKYFAPAAGRELRKSSFGWPAEAARVFLKKRKVRIALQFDGGRRGVATVKLAGRARVEGDRLRIFHRSTLWLEKTDGRWRVIAFEAIQHPVR